MKQKRVSGGQKIHGNISAAAINQLPRLIENEQMREVNKAGGPIPAVGGPGHFIFGNVSGLAVGEWAYLNRPVFPGTGALVPVNEATWFFDSSMREAPTPTALGTSGPSQYVKQMLPAMHVGQGMFQVSGLARTRIQFPEGVLASSNLYRTAHIGDNAVPIATDTDAGDLDIIWHKEIDAENRIHAAVVRFPTGPRPPRTAQYNLRLNGVTYNGGTVEATGTDGQLTAGANTYHGTQIVSPADIQLLRSGDYMISMSVYFRSYSWTSRPSRSGKVSVELFKRGGTLSGGKYTVWGNPKTVEELGQPPYGQIFAASTHLLQVEAGDKFSVKASADIGTADIGVQMTIAGPFNNHFPESGTYW
ncbi:hypothetical protein AB1K70_26670 [Bremerella sp. JC770]|uniref:hypothetical protein n=1 Tax=Bremerella sp. JC770 TaxID=3232137 RepID=UPI0034574D58